MSANGCVLSYCGFAFSLAMWTGLELHWIKSDSWLIMQNCNLRNLKINFRVFYVKSFWNTWLMLSNNYCCWWWLLRNDHLTSRDWLPTHVLWVYWHNWNCRINLSIRWRVGDLVMTGIWKMFRLCTTKTTKNLFYL